MSDNAPAEVAEVGAPEEATLEEASVTPNDLAAETEAKASESTEPVESEESTETPEEADSDGVDDTDADDETDASEEAAKLHRQLRKKNAENKTLRARAVAAERKLLQRDVAEEVGLPSGMAARLVGDTRDALVKDAKSLLEQFERRAFVPGGLPRDGVHYGDRLAHNPDDETDLSKIGARIYER
ncbi:hypothetical protein ACUY2L_06835 [Corynebacterium mastitidis]